MHESAPSVFGPEFLDGVRTMLDLVGTATVVVAVAAVLIPLAFAGYFEWQQQNASAKGRTADAAKLRRRRIDWPSSDQAPPAGPRRLPAGDQAGPTDKAS